MAIWLCRAGRYGEYEARFLEDNKIFYTFEEIAVSLSSFGSRRDLQEYFLQVAPATKKNAAKVFAGQGYVFCNEMAVGDLIITPSKTSPGVLHFAEVAGEYVFDENAEESYRHARPVKWFAEMRREQFDQDIQSSLGALMTICKINQEDRVRQTVTTFMNSASCTSVLPPPPPIWSFCHLTQSRSILSKITKDMVSLA